MKMNFKLTGVENSHLVTKATDSAFLLLIQRALLLGLKCAGYLTEMQHRQAEEDLLRQNREDVNAKNIDVKHDD